MQDHRYIDLIGKECASAPLDQVAIMNIVAS